MDSLSRVAYGPSPPPADTKGSQRGRSAGRLQRAVSPTSTRADGAKAASAPSRKREARRLVEEYWQSVWHSHHDPPLYHSFSDRYGGAKGIPYAARKAAVAARVAAGAARYSSSVTECLAAADAAFADGQLSDAQARLEHALAVLQNSAESGGLRTVTALTEFRGDSAEDVQREYWVAEVLRRLGTLELIRGHYAEARELLNGSITADPLHLDSYLLRASCCEALRCFAEAYDDYAKYMKMAEPSMEVLAHSGKCAAEAGLSEVAKTQLQRLLTLSEGVLAGTAADEHFTTAMSPNSTYGASSLSVPPLAGAAWAAGSMTLPGSAADASSHVDLLRSACAFYVTHAYFYLGFVAEAEAATAPAVTGEAAALRRQATAYYGVAVRNADYVQSYEDSVRRSMAAGDFALARHLLRYLQKMNPHRASYFLDAASACGAEGDVQGELRALSAALDRQQTVTERRATLFARGAVHADELRDWSRAIRDFTLLLATPAGPQPSTSASGAAVDWCTPLALVRRAAAYRHRQEEGSRTGLLQREDEEAALTDYAAFLEALEAVMAATRCDAADVPELCQPHHVIAALLVLANGAYHRHQHSSAVRYFCRAIALGWRPESAMPALLPAEERLADQLYTSMAHHVMALYPPGDDMFRVPYEVREATTMSLSSSISAAAEVRRTTKLGDRANAGAARSYGAEGERSGFACLPLMYAMVDQRYQQLRALEPTFFSAIEDAFLDAWEPYRSEVERLKEEALSTRAGRRGKR